MELKFNNKQSVKKVSTILHILMMLAIVPIGLYYLSYQGHNKMLEMGIWLVLIVVVVLYYIGGYCYVDVEITKAKVDIKFYNLFPFWREYRRIVLPIEKLKYIKVRSGLGFIGASLLVCGRIKGRLAMFPTVGLSACSQQQINELKKYANEISK